MEPKIVDIVKLRRDFAEFLQQHDVPILVAVRMMELIESLSIPDTIEAIEALVKAA